MLRSASRSAPHPRRQRQEHRPKPGLRMSIHLVRGVVVVSAMALALPPLEAFAQPNPVHDVQAEVTEFGTAQLDALLASIALYPDELLTQILMASTFPLQVVAAARWLDKDENKRLKGDALIK